MKAPLIELICNDLRALQDEAILLNDNPESFGIDGDIALNARLEVYAKICAKRILNKVNKRKGGR